MQRDSYALLARDCITAVQALASVLRLAEEQRRAGYGALADIYAARAVRTALADIDPLSERYRELSEADPEEFFNLIGVEYE